MGAFKGKITLLIKHARITTKEVALLRCFSKFRISDMWNHDYKKGNLKAALIYEHAFEDSKYTTVKWNLNWMKNVMPQVSKSHHLGMTCWPEFCNVTDSHNRMQHRPLCLALLLSRDDHMGTDSKEQKSKRGIVRHRSKHWQRPEGAGQNSLLLSCAFFLALTFVSLPLGSMPFDWLN